MFHILSHSSTLHPQSVTKYRSLTLPHPRLLAMTASRRSSKLSIMRSTFTTNQLMESVARQQRRSAAIDLSRAPVGTPLRATEAQPKIQLLQRQQTPSPADDSVEDLSAERRDSGVAGWSSSLPVEERDNMAGTALRKESGVFLNVFSDGELSRPSSRGKNCLLTQKLCQDLAFACFLSLLFFSC